MRRLPGRGLAAARRWRKRARKRAMSARKRSAIARKRTTGARKQVARRLVAVRRANEAFPWLLALDLLGWRDTPRDRVINTLREAHADKRGAYLLDGAFAARRPPVREADKLGVK
jgi:hypothetical protein